MLGVGGTVHIRSGGFCRCRRVCREELTWYQIPYSLSEACTNVRQKCDRANDRGRYVARLEMSVSGPVPVPVPH